MSWKRTGYIKPEELEDLGLLPSKARFSKGPVAILECPEEIPCNICVSACPYGAISKEKIYSKPRLNEDKCIGCGVCVAKCPGLAIFVVDLSKGEKAYVTLPHELLPAPVKGERVILLSRDGREVGEGVVVKAWNYDGTWVATVETPRELAMDVRAIKAKR